MSFNQPPHNGRYISPQRTDKPTPPDDFLRAITAFEFDKALAALWGIITTVNREIEEKRAWDLIQPDDGQLRGLLGNWLDQLWVLTTWLQPFLPETCHSIQERLFSGPVHKVSPLFPRQ